MKLFNRWDTSSILVEDPGLKKYINLNPIMIPRSLGRNATIRFYKTKKNIMERFMNKIMVPGHKGKKHHITSRHITGKYNLAYNITLKTLEKIENETKENPIKIFVKAIENAAPREEITTIEYGGARYPQAVECAPQRRIDMALKQMVQGSYAKTFNKKKKIYEALSEEIINAYRLNQASQAISKKLELERQADASR